MKRPDTHFVQGDKSLSFRDGKKSPLTALELDSETLTADAAES